MNTAQKFTRAPSARIAAKKMEEIDQSSSDFERGEMTEFPHSDYTASEQDEVPEYPQNKRTVEENEGKIR